MTEPLADADAPRIESGPARRHPALLELRSGQRRFLLGDLMEPVRFFCGKPTDGLRPYCRDCAQRAYVTLRLR